jgi:hypothetical protein
MNAPPKVLNHRDLPAQIRAAYPDLRQVQRALQFDDGQPYIHVFTPTAQDIWTQASGPDSWFRLDTRPRTTNIEMQPDEIYTNL